MSKQTTSPNDWEAKKASNIRNLRYWTLAWVLTSALAAFGPRFIWDYHTALTILGVVINVVIYTLRHKLTPLFQNLSATKTVKLSLLLVAF